MATSCPIGFDAQRLRAEVSAMYATVADDPSIVHHFHCGPEFAVQRLGYDAEVLARVPEAAKASFAGVGNPHAIGSLAAGETVLDVGCGAGTDLLIAAMAVGPEGRAIGVDMTPQMCRQARTAADELGLSHVQLLEGDAEALPVPDASVDVVISNGVLNLTTDKLAAFREIVRVLRPGGRIQLADIVVASELSEGIRGDIDLWTS